jgi:hypothetical protein
MTPPDVVSAFRRTKTNRRWWTALEAAGIAIFMTVVVMATPVIAGDSSYRRIVKQLRSEYRATEQSLYGAGVLGGLAVAVIRPAGISTVNFTILRDLDVVRERDFNRVVRGAVESKWRPVVVYSSPAKGEWTHVYSQPDGSHIRLLVVTRAREEAVVAEVRIDPDKLSAFIDNPQILGVRVGSR